MQPESPLSVNELEDAFFSLKISESSSYDDISSHVVRNRFGPLLKPLMHVQFVSRKRNLPR